MRVSGSPEQRGCGGSRQCQLVHDRIQSQHLNMKISYKKESLIYESKDITHFRHLLGSFFILLTQVCLPVMISPSLIVWFATSGDQSLIMRWAVHWPSDLLI